MPHEARREHVEGRRHFTRIWKQPLEDLFRSQFGHGLQGHSCDQGWASALVLPGMLEGGLTGYSGRSSGWAQTCAMACICGSASSCMASPSLEDLCSSVVRVLTVLKPSSCSGSAQPCFLQHPAQKTRDAILQPTQVWDAPVQDPVHRIAKIPPGNNYSKDKRRQDGP